MGAQVGGGKGPNSNINITPLVDVVLVLLIIFMVLTPLMEKEMGVRVPEEPDKTEITPPPPPDLPPPTVLRVKEDGRFFINTEAVNDDNLVQRLIAYYRLAKSQEAKLGQPVIFFDADDKAKYVRVVKALDSVRDASPVWVIGMMTEKLKTEEVPTAPQTPGAPGAPGAAPGGVPPAPAPTAPPK
jgi:biopolymer transport protein ExbD